MSEHARRAGRLRAAGGRGPACHPCVGGAGRARRAAGRLREARDRARGGGAVQGGVDAGFVLAARRVHAHQEDRQGLAALQGGVDLLDRVADVLRLLPDLAGLVQSIEVFREEAHLRAAALVSAALCMAAVWPVLFRIGSTTNGAATGIGVYSSADEDGVAEDAKSAPVGVSTHSKTKEFFLWASFVLLAIAALVAKPVASAHTC